MRMRFLSRRGRSSHRSGQICQVGPHLRMIEQIIHGVSLMLDSQRGNQLHLRVHSLVMHFFNQFKWWESLALAMELLRSASGRMVSSLLWYSRTSFSTGWSASARPPLWKVSPQSPSLKERGDIGDCLVVDESESKTETRKVARARFLILRLTCLTGREGGGCRNTI